jgi:hypothetical protein
MLDSIGVTKRAALRDRAMIGLMVYSFARIGAALASRLRMFLCRTASPGVVGGQKVVDFRRPGRARASPLSETRILF